MAVSLEAREPLLDHRLIEFAASLPEEMRVRKGQGKWLMKQAMGRYLPDNILHRPKQGFVTPISQWFRGSLAGAAREIVQRAPLAKTGWIDRGSLHAMIETHIRGVSDHSRLIWQMLMLDRSIAHLGIS
jgi:asparagine synthase (glutamine-hydrolysing)